MAKEGTLTEIAQWKIGELPLGAVAIGAGIGGIGDALSGFISGVVPQVPSWGVKGISALAVLKFGPGVIGYQASTLGALFLTYDAVQEIIDIRGTVRNILAGIGQAKIAGLSPGTLSSPKALTAGGGNGSGQKLDAMDMLRLSMAGGR